MQPKNKAQKLWNPRKKLKPGWSTVETEMEEEKKEQQKKVHKAFSKAK